MNADHRTDDSTDGIDALGRRAATALHRDVERRTDVDAALRAVLEAEHTPGPTVHRPMIDRTTRRPARAWLGAAAAVTLVAAGAVVYAATRDGRTRVVPSDSTDVVDVDVSTTSETTSPETTPITATTEPTATPPSPPSTPTPTPTIAPPPATEVDALVGLAAPAPLDPVDVPAYLPSAPVADPSQVRLTSYATPLDTVTHLVQTWASDSGRIIEVTTRLGGVGAPVLTATDVVPTAVYPWDEAVVVTTMAEGYSQIQLNDPSGTVTLWGSGVTSDELVSLAARMTLTPAGWQLPIDASSGFVETHSGWRRAEFATRTMQWDTGSVRGELSVSIGMPDSIRTGFFGAGTPSTLDEVGGAPAMVSEPGSGTTVSWSPAPDVVVVLGYTGSVAETLALARSLEPVEVATLEASGIVDTSPGDGCDSYFFC